MLSCALLALVWAVRASGGTVPGLSNFTVPAGFPSGIFSSYYVPPAPTQEPQPIIFDPVLNITFPKNLTSPDHIPTTDDDPVLFPVPLGPVSNESADAFVDMAVGQIKEIIAYPGGLSGSCSKCVTALNIGKLVAQIVPEKVPKALVRLCQETGFRSNDSCVETYGVHNYGAIYTQLLALADTSGSDGHYICNFLSSSFCTAPTTAPLNASQLFPKPKPANATAPSASGTRVKVLHLSDLHLDPRFAPGAEANCSSYMCCRKNVVNTAIPPGQISMPASLYGSFTCDSPYNLVTAALQAVGPLTGVGANESFAWTIYTGDLVSHDPQNQLSRSYVEYTETSVYSMLHSFIKGPVFAVLGNHDSNPEAIDGPHSMPGPLGNQFSWNYDHVAGLWKNDSWIDEETAQQARLHYGGYSVRHQLGLRVITLNTDFWLRGNILNFINTTDPDASGMLKWLIADLQAAEDAGERVWILGHVLSGWDGTNALPNPSNLFYQIVDRYSPHVIASVMFGHTHEDQNFVFYANNGTTRDAAHALTTAWMGPSVTPLTNLNSGFRMYEVDTRSFDIYDAYTYYADVAYFAALDPAATGPTFQLEYSTRDAYRQTGWPDDAPLNATFWHGVTVAMETNRTLISLMNTYQGKSSVRSPACTSDACAKAKVCYMRSGSQALGSACIQGYGSVQAAFGGA